MAFAVPPAGMAQLSRAVPVHDLDAVIGAAEALGDILGDHYRAVLAAGATERDGQVALAFADVVRDQVDEQLRDARNELACLGKRADVFRHPLVPACESSELGDEVRIGQETDVKDQVSVLGHSLAKSETDAGNQKALLRRSE